MHRPDIRLRAAALAAFCLSALPAPARAAAGESGPFSVQLHMHGSLSEDRGTMHGHFYQGGPDLDAGLRDVDVEYLTDHAERIEGYLAGFSSSYDMCVPGACGSCAQPPCTSLVYAQSQTAPVCPAPLPISTTLQKGWTEGGQSFNYTVKFEPAPGAPKATPGFTESALHFRSNLAAGSPIQSRTWTYTSSMWLYRHSMQSGVRLSFSLWPSVLNKTMRAEMRVQLSYDTVNAFTPQYLHYLLTPDPQTNPGILPPDTATDKYLWLGDARNKQNGVRGLTAAAWNKFTVDVSQDAIQKFGAGADSPRDDQSSYEFRYGVSVKGPADIWFDDFRITQALVDQPLFEAQAAMLASDPYFIGSPAVRQAQEVTDGYSSSGIHMTVFGTPCLARQDDSNWSGSPACPAAAPRMARCQPDAVTNPDPVCAAAAPQPTSFPRNVTSWVQAQRAYWNDPDIFTGIAHMFGVSGGITSPQCRDDARVDAAFLQLYCRDLYGADFLEVGYRTRELPFSEHARVWDRLGQKLKFVTGTSVTDAHTHTWDEFVVETGHTWLWTQAPSPTPHAVRDALARGRAFGGALLYADTAVPGGVRADLELHQGGVTCATAGAGTCRAIMGQVKPVNDPAGTAGYTAVASWSGLDWNLLGGRTVEIRMYRDGAVIGKKAITAADRCFSVPFTDAAPATPAQAQVLRWAIWATDAGFQCCDTQNTPVCATDELALMFSNPVYLVNSAQPPVVPPERTAGCP